LANRLLRPGTKIFKVIGKEVLEKPILVRADAFSAGAAAAICSSGGQAVVLHSSGSDGSRSVERK
jgi:ribosomal protein L18E